MPALATTFISLGASLIIAIIGYFLKRTMSKVDKSETDIDIIKEKYLTISAHDKIFSECKGDIKQIREDYTPKKLHEKDIDECKGDIKKIKEDYITKEDFFRVQSQTDRKLDKIMDILLEMKGDK